MTSEFVLNVKTQIFLNSCLRKENKVDNNNAMSAYLCKSQC